MTVSLSVHISLSISYLMFSLSSSHLPLSGLVWISPADSLFGLSNMSWLAKTKSDWTVTSQAPEPSDWLTLGADAGEWGKIGGGGYAERGGGRADGKWRDWVTLLGAYRPSLSLILSSSPARSLPGFSSSHGGNSNTRTNHSWLTHFLPIFAFSFESNPIFCDFPSQEKGRWWAVPNFPPSQWL